MGAAELRIIHDNNFMNMNTFSQSTHSLPALVSGQSNGKTLSSLDIKRFQSTADVSVLEKRKIVHQFSKTDLDSIENVCKFINNNSEPNLLELPGLKMKQTAGIPIREQIPSALRLKIFIHEEKVLKTTLKSKDMTISSLNSSVFNKLKLTEAESCHLCLCRRVEDEFMYIPPSERVLDQGTNMFYLRLIKPLNSSLRTKLYDSKFDVKNCGNFAYKGRTNKKADSSTVKMVVNSSGIEVNCDFILWKYVSQISYSATFLQILYKHSQGLSKKKVCFESDRIKHIYNLIMFFMEMEKQKRAQEQPTSTHQTKPKEEENKFENFCKKICSFTKDAVKSIGTPRRKRAKSIDSHSYQKPKKSKSLGRSLSSADMGRIKRNILDEFKDDKPVTESSSTSSSRVTPPTSTSTSSSSVMSPSRISSTSTKRKSETHLDNNTPMKRTKIVTNPRVSEKENQSSAPGQSSQGQRSTAGSQPGSSQGSASRVSGRTPVRMGIRSVATVSSKPPCPPSSSSHPFPSFKTCPPVCPPSSLKPSLPSLSKPCPPPPPQEERKIFYTTALKTDFSYFGIKLKLSHTSVFIESVERMSQSCKFQSGDRILAINGISLENCTQERAEHLLHISGQFVNFIISRKLS